MKFIYNEFIYLNIVVKYKIIKYFYIIKYNESS